MGNFRIPGALGCQQGFGLGITNGPIDSPWDLDLKLKQEFTPKTPGPVDMCDWIEEATRAVHKAGLAAQKEDEEELKLLVKIYTYLADSGGTTRYSFWKVTWEKRGKKKVKKQTREYLFEQYCKHRDTFFGSREKYREELTEAIKELDHKPAKGRTLRFYIEPPQSIRKNNKDDWEKAQNVFYTWVRKAFHKKYGDDKDYPAVIRTGMSDELKTKLEKVKSNYKRDFKAGGTNPRPTKLKLGGAYHYRLGTISDHGVGRAIDIDASTNPQINSTDWGKLETYTGKKMNATQRKAAWEKEPKKLYDYIKGVSDEFVRKANKAVSDIVDDAKKKLEAAEKATKAAEKELEKLNKDAQKDKDKAKLVAAQQKVIEQAKKDQEKAKKEKETLEAAVTVLKDKTKSNSAKAAERKLLIDKAQEKDKQLKAISDNFIIDWAFENNGFISLSWDLVEACQQAGLKWGVTFAGNVDIHHFEL
jgi:hypothetical protein